MSEAEQRLAKASRGLVVLPGVTPSAMARIARLIGAAGHLVPQPGCLLLVLGDGDDPGEATRLVSRAFGSRSPVLAVRLHEGYLSVQRWQRGHLVDAPPAGLVADHLPQVVTPILAGTLDPATLPGAVQVRPGGGLLRRLLGR